MNPWFRLTRAPLLLLLLLSIPAPALSQGTELAGQTLGRAYWHVFIAYAIAWVLVLGWAVAIGRRLSRVERRLEQ